MHIYEHTLIHTHRRSHICNAYGETLLQSFISPPPHHTQPLVPGYPQLRNPLSEQAGVPTGSCVQGCLQATGTGTPGLGTHAAIHSATPQQRGHSCRKGGGGAHCSSLPLCKFSCPPVGFANRPPPSCHHGSPGRAGDRGD